MEVWVISANIYETGRCMGKMSPYVNINVDKRTLKTNIAKNADTKPAWNDVFTCTVPDVEEIEVVVMDKGVFRNYLVGSARVEVAYILSQQRTDEDLKLYRKGKEVGYVRIVINRLSEHLTQLDSGVSMRTSQIIDATSQMQPSQFDNDEFRVADDAISVPSTYYANNIMTSELEDGKFDIVLPGNPEFKVDGGDCAFEFPTNGKEEPCEDTRASSGAFGENTTQENIPMLPDPEEVV